MFDAHHLRQLHALGLTPMRLRGHAAVGDIAQPASPQEPAAVARAVGAAVRLWFPPDHADAFDGPHARLLTQLLASLGLRPEQAKPGLPGDAATLPILAFGPGAPEGAIRLATLEKLRDPIEKRIAWPLLRSLRQRLRQARG